LPWTWLRALPISSSAPQLTASLVVLGVVLLTAADRRLAVLAFVMLRIVVLIILRPVLPGAMGAASAASHLAIVMVCAMPVLRARQASGAVATRPARDAAFLMTPPFRALAASIGLLLAHGFVQTYASDLAPLAVVVASSWLVALGMLALLLSASGLGTAMGVVVLADACRLMYALSQPDVWVWATWSACDLLIVLAGAHLSRIEAVARQNSAEERTWDLTGLSARQ